MRERSLVRRRAVITRMPRLGLGLGLTVSNGRLGGGGSAPPVGTAGSPIGLLLALTKAS